MLIARSALSRHGNCATVRGSTVEPSPGARHLLLVAVVAVVVAVSAGRVGSARVDVLVGPGGYR